MQEGLKARTRRTQAYGGRASHRDGTRGAHETIIYNESERENPWIAT